jgi:peptidoglycan/LPS O-acetylase OafA/YrhL
MIELFQLLALYCISIMIFCAVAARLPLLSAQAQHRVSSLDGLRGILATAVMVHHFTVTYIWHTTSIWRGTSSKVLNNMGAVPVSLFFMITGYLFAAKIYRSTPDWGALLSSRVRRIFPMYLFTVMLIAVISFYQTQGEVTPIDETIKALGRWMIFIGGPINGFEDSKLINASVHWTLSYEALFYLSLPLLYCVLRRRFSAVAIIIVILAIACLWPEYRDEFHKRFVKLFLIGIAVALLEDKLRRTSINFSGTVCSVVAVVILILSLKMRTYSTLQMLILGVPFALFVMGNSVGGLLENRGLKILGEASFSIYLLHGIVIYTLFSLLGIYDFSTASLSQYAWYLPLVIMLVCSVSVLTYWGVEHPFLRVRKTPANSDTAT